MACPCISWAAGECAQVRTGWMTVPERRLEAVVEVLECGSGQAHETPLPGDKMKRRSWHQHSVSSLGSQPHRFCLPHSRTPSCSPHFTKQLTQGHGLPAQCRSLSPSLPCQPQITAPSPAAQGTHSSPSPALAPLPGQEGSGEAGDSPTGPPTPGLLRHYEAL